MSEQAPVIRINEQNRPLLEKKQREYQERRNQELTKAPEISLPHYALAIITALLEQGEINTHELSRKMAAQMGEGFNLGYFERYCGIIEDYATTGGQNVEKVRRAVVIEPELR